MLGTAIFFTVSGVVGSGIVLLQCVPVHDFWDFSPHPGAPHPGCMPREVFQALLRCNAVFSLVTDGIFAILPIYLIWDTKMGKRTKIGLGFVLGLGLTTAGVNIVRLKYTDALGTWDDYTCEYSRPTGHVFSTDH